MATTLSTETRNGLFFYRVFDPVYRQFVTIDSGKQSEAEAFTDLRRYVTRQNNCRRRLGVPLLSFLKHPAQMRFERRAA